MTIQFRCEGRREFIVVTCLFFFFLRDINLEYVAYQERIDKQSASERASTRSKEERRFRGI